MKLIRKWSIGLSTREIVFRANAEFLRFNVNVDIAWIYMRIDPKDKPVKWFFKIIMTEQIMTEEEVPERANYLGTEIVNGIDWHLSD